MEPVEIECRYPLDQQTVAFIKNIAKTPKDVRSFLDCYEEDVSTFMSILGAIPPGPGRAAEAGRLVDRAVKQFMVKFVKTGITPPCKEGCAHCCRLRIETCRSELDGLAERIIRDCLPIDWARLCAQAGRHQDDFYTAKMGKNNRCVFLGDDNLCKVYDIRPVACREHLAAMNPEKCSMDLDGQFNSYIYIEESRAIANALMLLEMSSVTDLATGLLERKQKICPDT